MREELDVDGLLELDELEGLDEELDNALDETELADDIDELAEEEESTEDDAVTDAGMKVADPLVLVDVADVKKVATEGSKVVIFVVSETGTLSVVADKEVDTEVLADWVLEEGEGEAMLVEVENQGMWRRKE